MGLITIQIIFRFEIYLAVARILMQDSIMIKIDIKPPFFSSIYSHVKNYTLEIGFQSHVLKCLGLNHISQF